jgi:aryl-alcohol dehydrogenase-like predicted oxidoreductase
VETVPLGSTGLTVTPIGLGLAALGRPAYINLGRDDDLGHERGIEVMERRTHAILDAAHELGIRYFDVARSYGYAERFLASWLELRGLEPGAVTVGSKWGYAYTGAWAMDAEVHEVKDHSVGALRRQYGESDQMLGSHIDLYQIHSATLETGVLENREVLAELASLRASGVAVGLTTSGPRQADTLRRALEVDVDGVNPFACVQATYNLLELSAAEALAEAHAAGWGVIVKEALANGRLSPANEDDHFAPRRTILERIAERHSCSLDAVAIAAVLAQPWADLVLSGAVTTEQLESNAAALRISLGDDDLESLRSLAEPSGDYWSRRSSLAWS